MFASVTLRTSDRAASQRFYETVLATIGIEKTDDGAWGEFALAQATDDPPPTRGLHIGFAAPSREHADAFWRTGTEAGYRHDGAPGPRPQYSPTTTAPSCSTRTATAPRPCTTAPAARGRDRPPLDPRRRRARGARAFYLALAPRAGFEVVHDTPDRVRFVGGRPLVLARRRATHGAPRARVPRGSE